MCVRPYDMKTMHGTQAQKEREKSRRYEDISLVDTATGK